MQRKGNEKDPFALAEELFADALQCMKKDKCHAPLLFCQYEDLHWETAVAQYEDTQGKQAFFERVAEKVRRDGIVAVVFISECWVGDLDVYLDTGLSAGDQKNRREALILDALTNTLRHIQYTAVFHRKFLGRIVFEDTQVETHENWCEGYLDPICRVWKAHA